MSLARCGIAVLTAVSLVITSWPLHAQTVDGAAEARALAPGLTPDAETLFQLEDGTVTLDGGGEIPLEQLFPGEGDAAPLADTYGDEGGMVDLGHAAQQQLLNAPSSEGEAYRTLLDSPYDGPRDLSHEPWFDNTRTILDDVERLGGELGRCVPTQVVGSNPRTVWQPDLRVCTRPAQEPTTGACRIEHTLGFSEQNAFARVGVYGAELNTFRLDFANGSWTQLAPSDGSHFAGEVPKLDQAGLCSDPARVSFTLAAAGTWATAPVPGELDDSITVTVPQQPSCANGLQAVVQLADPGGDGQYKSGSELALHILGVTDEWWPQACLDIAQGQELPAACTITATALSPPDQEGCAYHDGRRICQGDPLWQAIPPPPFDPEETRLSRLAGGADINWSCPAGTTTVPVTDTCGPLQDRPECKLKSTSCVAGTEDAAGTCTVVEDTYDCGQEVVIDDGGIRTELQCDGEVKCLGDSCTGGTQETNPNFADVAAVLKGAELAALDGACNPETGQCAVFTGETASCKRVLAADIDCCQDVQGVSLASYLELAFAISSLGGAMATLDTTSPLRGGWEFMASPLSMSWDWIGGQFTSALNGVTGSTTASTSASQSLGILGAAQQQLMRATAQWTLETFGPAATNALFTVNGGAAVAADGTLAAGTVQVGGYAAVAGAVLFWVGVAYTVYQVAMILAQIIWACEEEELELAVRRELKQCTNLGSYCATDTPAGCLVSKRSYCCYSSPFSRILQEEVRPQLGLTMGDAEDPDCSGIPLQDLARIDWSKVDLDEWIAMLATNGQLPDAGSITVERLTGNLRAIDSAAFAGQDPAATARAADATPMAAAASVPGGTGRRPDVIERTLARTAQTDIPAALTAARDELMPYLHPGGGAPKPRPETYDIEDIPPELLLPWHLPNRWMDQLPPDPGPVDPGPIDPGPIPELCYAANSCRIQVTSNSELSTALSSAECGCTIGLAPGTYAGFTYARSCSPDKPLAFEAAAGVRITGTLTIAGNGGIFHGFQMAGGVNIAGDYNRITRALFTQNGQIDFKEGAAFNRIDHNDFVLPPQGTGETNAAIAFYRPRSVAQMYQSNRIDSNFFTTNTPTPSSATYGTAIFLCMYGAQDGYQYLSQFGSARTTIENNLFENWGRKNVMEVKCSDNRFINNTMVNTGRILNRHGGRNLYQNNIFDNLTTGLAIREFDNQVINNFFNKARIVLYRGTRNYPQGECYQDRDWMPAGYPGAPQGPPAVRTYLDRNRGPLVIGDLEGGGCEIPVLETQIACHEGSISYLSHAGTNGPASTSCAFTMPKRLTHADVGRGAPEDCPLPSPGVALMQPTMPPAELAPPATPNPTTPHGAPPAASPAAAPSGPSPRP